MAAFSDLCDLVIQSSDFEARQPHIMKAVGSDGSFLVKSITNLSPFLASDHGEDDTDIRNEAALSRFKVACKTFLRAMSSEKHPIVLFLDDIQWMDNGSRHVIEALLQDNDLRYVMLVLSYRDEEANKVATVLTEEIRRSALDIQLVNLNSEDVFLIISGAMSSVSDDTRNLAELIMTKTSGNPYHVKSFFDTIVQEGLLFFEPSDRSYSFNVDEIQREIMVSNTMVDLLSRKIGRLPSDVQETLKISSLLGFRFREEIILEVACKLLQNSGDGTLNSSIAGSSASSTLLNLAIAVDEKVVEKAKDGYQFSHDKIQSVFQAMYSENEKVMAHKVIGEVFLARTENDSLYHAAVHLNRAIGLLRDDHERVELARINLAAAKFCKQKCAFDGAVSLLRIGSDLINENEKWSKFFDLSFEMIGLLAKMELVAGHFDACKATTVDALRHATSPEMKIELLLVGVDCRMANNEMEEMIATANDALAVFGVKMPRKVGVHHVLGKLLALNWMLRRTSDEKILALPPVHDQTMAAAVRLLVNVSMFCFLQDQKEQAIYTAMLGTELTLKNGLTPYSASAFVAFGLAQLAIGKVDSGVRLGSLAMKILEKFSCRDAECSAITLRYAGLSHWKEPISPIRDHLLSAISSGFAVGDMIYGIYAVANCNRVRLMLGENLEVLEHEYMRPVYQRMCDLRGEDGMIMWTQPTMQFVVNMQSHAENWTDLVNLTGEFMNEQEYMLQASAMNHKILTLLAWMSKIQLAYHFGFFRLAESILHEYLLVAPKIVHLNFAAMSSYFYAGMIHFERYRETGQRKNLKAARGFKKELLNLQSVGSPDAGTFLTLFEAEEVSLRTPNDAAEILVAYDKAIGAFALQGWSHLEGVANERAAFVQGGLGRIEEAERYFDRALEVYRYDWGATAKYEWLLEKSRACIRELQMRDGTSNRLLAGMVLPVGEEEDRVFYHNMCSRRTA